MQMISVGEETGKLDEMLLKVAEIEERHMRARTKTLVSLLAPALILVVGGARRVHGHRFVAAHFPDESRHSLKISNEKLIKNQPAFTLMEIMVVVVILGILAATIVPQFIGQTRQAKENTAKATMAELEPALERYNMHMDRHPSTEEGLKVLVEPPTGQEKKWRGPYIKMMRPIPGGTLINTEIPAHTTKTALMFGLGPLTALMVEKDQRPILETGNDAGMKRSFPGGFTLLELMIVIILIGVVTAVVLPEMRGTYEDMLLRSTSRKILDLSALASSRAVTTGKERSIKFDTVHASYDLGEAKSPMDGGFAAEKSFEKGNWDTSVSSFGG